MVGRTGMVTIATGFEGNREPKGATAMGSSILGSPTGRRRSPGVLAIAFFVVAAACLSASPARAQDAEALDALIEATVSTDEGKAETAEPPTEIETPDGPDWIPAKQLFGFVIGPSSMKARSIGGYAKGCLAGATMLPVNGKAWQAMRLSRGRNWGHPALVDYVQRFADDLKSLDDWPGLLVGDMSQPRGGPMLTGHASHQIGLDADIWFKPMPERKLSYREREYLEPVPLADPSDTQVIKKNWNPGYVRLLARAVSYPEVERVFVHPAIKRALCESTKEGERAWLSKVRPWYGHNYHFHVRLACPAGTDGCSGQDPVDLNEDGCGKELTDWLKKVSAKPKPQPAPKVKPKPPGWKPPRPPKPTTVDDLPAECRQVLVIDNPSYLERAAPVRADVPKPVRNPLRRSS